MSPVTGDGTEDAPWVLTTPSGQSQYEAYRDEAVDPPALVVQVGKTQLRYALRGIDDLHRHAGGPRRLDAARLPPTRTSRPPRASVEAWARGEKNPVGGWYGLRKGYRGRFANYVPPRAGTPRTGRGRAQPQEQPDAAVAS